MARLQLHLQNLHRNVHLPQASATTHSSMVPSSSLKKRKRDDEVDPQITLSILDKSPSSVGPVIASFPALHPPKSTSFAVYGAPPKLGSSGSRDEETGAEQGFARRSLILAGETESVEFYSTSESEAARQSCRYMIGVYNKKTSTVTLRPAPLSILGRRVKALKSLAPAPSTSSNERVEQRNALGETFGTRKALKAIRAAERNRVDVSAMEGVTGHIQDSIEAGTKSLPTVDEAKELADSSRLIPRFDIGATRPEDVYKLSWIIPDAEFGAIPIKDILAAGSLEDRLQHVSYQHSDWIKQHLSSIFAASKPNKRQLKIVMYIACLFTFRAGAPRFCREKGTDKDLKSRLTGMPSVLVDGIYARFSETVRGSTEAHFTSDNAVSLMTNMFALCLHVDNFATDTSLLAADLREPVTKINQHFKLLGCKIEKLGAAETSRLGLGAATADNKRAVLRVPLEFPKTRLKRK